MKAAKPYPNLYPDKDRQGRQRWRLRVPGRKTVTIKGAFGSAEFAANYRAAVEGQAIEPKGLPIKHGTMAALAREYLRSAAFLKDLAPTTQKAKGYLVQQFIAKYGHLPVAGLKRHHVKLIVDAHAETPGSARNLLAVVKTLVALAIENGLIEDDPTTGIKRPKLSAEGWHAWDEDEIARFEKCHPIGSQARLALALALYTGQRRSDLIRMGKQHVREGKIAVAQQKTGVRLWIPLHRELKAIIDATPSDNLTYLVARTGSPLSPVAFSHRMKAWAREAGLEACPLHGLRKAACRRLAEAGCSTLEIMAVSGHSTLAMVQRYTAAAEQAQMAARAIARTEAYPRDEQSYPRKEKA